MRKNENRNRLAKLIHFMSKAQHREIYFNFKLDKNTPCYFYDELNGQYFTDAMNLGMKLHYNFINLGGDH